MSQKYYSVVVCEDYMLCTFFEKVVDVYETNNWKQIKSINTLLDFGGNRIAFSISKKLFCCANFYQGIAVYELETGNELWADKTLKAVQSVFLSTQYIFLHNEKKQVIILSIEDGKSLHLVEKVIGIYKTQNENVFILQTRTELKLLQIDNNKPEINPIKNLKVNDSFHTATLFNNKLFVSNLYTSFEAFSLNGEYLWSSDLEKGYVINSIYYNNSISALCCYAGFNNNSSQDSWIINIDIASGKVINKFLLSEDIIDIDISKNGKFIVCSNGLIIDSKTGGVINNFLPE